MPRQNLTLVARGFAASTGSRPVPPGHALLADPIGPRPPGQPASKAYGRLLRMLTLALSTALLSGQSATAAEYFAAPDGSDGSPGTFAAPWRTLHHAVARLAPGDTLYLRGGTYWETDIPLSSLRGTPDRPVRIAAYGNEHPIIDGGLRPFRDIGNDDWILHDPGKNIYRSRQAFSHPSSIATAKLYYGTQIYTLASYKSYDYLASDNHNYARQGPRYMGPGIFWDAEAGHVYIRLVAASSESTHGLSFNIPDDPDPRRHRIAVGMYSSGMSLGQATHIIIEGIALRHHYYGLRGSPQHATFRAMEVTPGNGAFVFDADSNNILIDGVEMNSFLPPWVGWTDIKGGEQPLQRLRTAGVSIQGASSGIEIRNSKFNGFFDGVLPVDRAHDLHIHHNTFYIIWDDTIQLGSATYNVEFAYNRIIGAGPSHHGSGISPYPGTKYFHHNIIDNTLPILWTRHDPQGYRAQHEQGWRNPVPFGSHEGSGNHEPDPWSIYNNTVVFYGIAGNFLKFNEWHENASGAPHLVFNNIFSQEYLPMMRACCLDPFVYWGRGSEVDDMEEEYDGNAYHGNPGNEALWFHEYTSAGVGFRLYSLDDFRASLLFAASQEYYSPGWEAAGIEADPVLDSFYVPQNSEVLNGGADVCHKGLPGIDGIYRGAVRPGTDGRGIGAPDGEALTGAASKSDSHRKMKCRVRR